MLGWMQDDFTGRGVESPRLDAELLVAHALGVPRMQLYLDLDRPLAAEELASIRALVKRRREREPVAYLLGRRDFWKRSFRVDPRVLVPRPDTETLVERAIALLRPTPLSEPTPMGESRLVADVGQESSEIPSGEATLVLDEVGARWSELDEPPADDASRTQTLDAAVEGTSGTEVGGEPSAPDAAVERAVDEEAEAARAGSESAAGLREGEPRFLTAMLGMSVPTGPVVDLCVGSGCVVVSMAEEVRERAYFATDLSRGALEVARANAEEAGVRVELREGDLFAGLAGPFALVVANPPYIAAGVMAGLEPEVTRHEPRMALVAGEDGLDVIRRLVPDAATRLVPGGALLVEIGEDQGAAVRELFEAAGLIEVRVLRDLGGRDRVVEGWRPVPR